MAEIPYYFETPIPKYFREHGWFKNPNTRLFVSWAFERCSFETREVPYDGQKLLLKPYQFIFGRKSCADELGLTEGEVRNQVKVLMNAGFLKNATNSTTKRYSIYEWSTELFLKTNNQVNNQVTTKSQPSNNHNQEDKKIRSKKEDHHPNPSSSKVVEIGEGIEGLTDDFSFEKNTENNQSPLRSNSYEMQHNINYQPDNERLEVISGIFLSPSDLDACIKIKGDIEKVKEAISFIMSSKKRKHAISDWPNALVKWKIENKSQVKIDDNLAYAEKLCKTFHDYKSGRGFRCRMYTDKKKDQRGVLIEPESAYKDPFFVAFSDGEFQLKCYNQLMENEMITKKKG